MPNLIVSENIYKKTDIQSNLNSSNADGSFTMADSKSLRNSSYSTSKQIFKKFSDFIMDFYVVCNH